MNNNKLVEKTITEWNDNVPEESLTLKVLAAKEKMLHTSRLYLKVDQTKTVSDLKRPARIDLSQESLAVQ
tara:strand:+ start:117 stop:326 length:210 start_codon:yes stop_codon:yes gene_type:complete